MDKLRKIGFSKLTPLEDALNSFFSHLTLKPIEEIETSEALNRILAEDIISELDIPPFDRSAMDGYAVKAEDTFGSSPKNPKTIKLVGNIEIGQQLNDLALKNGEAIRISTGAAIPIGADAVVKIEDTEIEDDIITLYTSVVPGKNIARQGEDTPKDTKIIKKGIELKPEHIALLSSLGFKRVKVKAKPKITK